MLTSSLALSFAVNAAKRCLKKIYRGRDVSKKEREKRKRKKRERRSKKGEKTEREGDRVVKKFRGKILK